MIKRYDVIYFFFLMIVLIPLEVLSGLLAYETIGSIASGIYFLIIVIVNLLALLVAVRSLAIATAIIFFAAVAIIPYQVVLGQRMLKIEREVTHIATYATEQRLEQGAFPKDLSQYNFQYPEVRRFISYSVEPTQNDFIIYYFIGTPGASHWYNTQTGWGYYPD